MPLVIVELQNILLLYDLDSHTFLCAHPIYYLRNAFYTYARISLIRISHRRFMFALDASQFHGTRCRSHHDGEWVRRRLIKSANAAGLSQHKYTYVAFVMCWFGDPLHFAGYMVRTDRDVGRRPGMFVLQTVDGWERVRRVRRWNLLYGLTFSVSASLRLSARLC